MKPSVSELAFFGLFVLSLWSYVTLDSRDLASKASPRIEAKGFAYQDGILHFPSGVARYVGEDPKPLLNKNFALVLGHLYFRDTQSVKIQPAALSIEMRWSETCVLIGSTLYLKSGDTVEMEPEGSEPALETCNFRNKSQI